MEGDPSKTAWFELESDTLELGSFFQFGTLDLAQLDGGVPATNPAKSFVLRRVIEGPTAFRGRRAATRLSIFNPGQQSALLRLSFVPLELDGSRPSGGPQVTRSIAARSQLNASISDLFSGSSFLGYLVGEVLEGPDVVAFEVIEFPDQQTTIGLNGFSEEAPSRSFSAQLASQPGFFTSVNLINTDSQTRRVRLTAILEDSSYLTEPVEIELRPGEQFTQDAGLLFSNIGPAGGAKVSFVGSLEVEADGPGVIGDVIFGDDAQLRFAAALGLQTRPFREAIFNQVANLPNFFTGLAFFFPKPLGDCTSPDAELTIQVYRNDGQLVEETTRTLGPGERSSLLVVELAPESAGQSGGYTLIRATQEIIAQMIFGALDEQGIRLLSAVPAEARPPVLGNIRRRN